MSVHYLTFPPNINWDADAGKMPVLGTLTMGALTSQDTASEALTFFASNGCPNIHVSQMTPIVNHDGHVIGFRAPKVKEII